MRALQTSAGVFAALLLSTAGLRAFDDKKPSAPAAHAPSVPHAPSGMHMPGGSHGAPAAARPNMTAPHNVGGGRTMPNAGGHTMPNAGGHTMPNAGGRTMPNAAGRTGAFTRSPGADMHTAGGMRGGAGSMAHGGPRPGMTPHGGNVARGPRGMEYHGANGTRANFRSDGHLREVHSRGMDIRHGPGGSRRVISERGDHRVVLVGHGHGYVERPYRYGGHEYYHRTYYAHGIAYSRVYRPYYYGRVAYYGYIPAYYYAPAYYGWAYAPWGAPVAYSWGWAGSPWYGAYGGWFNPYPVYASPSLWLTDYAMAATLQSAYQDQQAQQQQQQQQGPPDQGADTAQQPLTPETKQYIADEVQRQIAQERTEAQALQQNPQADPGAGGAPPVFDNGPHAFLVSSALDVADATGQECSVTPGDILAMNGAPPPDAPSATVRVMFSKGQDCAMNSTIAVQLQDLMDMQNQMRETIDKGMGLLASQQGQNGLPKAPATALRGHIESPALASAPAADPNTATELTQQEVAANTAEQEVMQESGAAASGPNAGPETTAYAPPAQTTPASSTVTIALGQSLEDVVSHLGNPKRTVDLGMKKIYIYDDMKITFLNGKVSNVE